MVTTRSTIYETGGPRVRVSGSVECHVSDVLIPCLESINLETVHPNEHWGHIGSNPGEVHTRRMTVLVVGTLVQPLRVEPGVGSGLLGRRGKRVLNHVRLVPKRGYFRESPPPRGVEKVPETSSGTINEGDLDRRGRRNDS